MSEPEPGSAFLDGLTLAILGGIVAYAFWSDWSLNQTAFVLLGAQIGAWIGRRIELKSLVVGTLLAGWFGMDSD